MTALPRTSFGALLVPDPRAALWAAESSYTQAGPRAGVPTSSTRSRGYVGASGVQTGDLTLRVQWPGFPTREAEVDVSSGVAYASGAQVIVSDDDGTTYYGRNGFACYRSWDLALFCDGSTAPETARDPSVLGLSDGSLILAAQVEDSGEGEPYAVEILTSPGATIGQWTRSTRVHTSATSGDRYRPALLELPDGTVLVYSVVRDSTSGSARYNVRLHYRAAGGSTWAYGGDVLQQDITSAAVVRVRVAYGQGQVVMLIETDNPDVRHYASSDLGCTFDLVETIEADGDPPFDPGSPDVTFGPAGFVVVLAGYSAANGLDAFVIGDGYDKIEDVRSAGDAVDVLGTVALTDGTTFVCTDETGALIAGGIITDRLYVAISYDGGSTWSDYLAPASESSMWLGTSSSDFIDTLSATVHEGQVVVACHWEVGTLTANEQSIGILRLGGWTSKPMPTHRRTLVETLSTRWSLTYVPIEEPQNTGAWTRTTTGGSESVQGSALVTVATASNTRFYQRTPTIDAARGVGVRLVWQPGGTGTVNDDSESLLVRYDNGTTTGYAVSIRFSGTQFQVYDVNAAGNVGSATGYTGPIEIEVWLSTSGEVATYFRTFDHDDLRAWTAGPSSSSLTDSGGAAGSNRIEWGARAGNAAGAQFTTYAMLTCEGDAVGQGLWGGFTSPTDLRGRLIAGRPYVGQGVRIEAVSGPYFRGEQFDVPTRYDFGIDRAVLEASPRLTHRTTSLAQQTYAWRFDDSIDVAVEGESGLLGIHLGRCNWPEVEVLLDFGSGFVSQGTVSRFDDFDGATVDIAGNTARPSADYLDAPHVLADEYAGGFAIFGTVGSHDSRRILRNTGGRMRAGRGVRPVFVLDDADGTESGVMRIVPKSSTILVDTKGRKVRGVKVVVPDATGGSNFAPPETYYEVGSVVIGWVWPFGADYSWGRTIEFDPPVDRFESPDLMTRTRVLGPLRRVFEIGWVDGLDESAVEWADDPDYFLPSLDAGARAAVMSEAETAQTLAGLMQRLVGPHTPVVLLPRVPVSAGLRHVHRWREHALVRFDAPLRIEARQGEEFRDEVVNVATITGREEV